MAGQTTTRSEPTPPGDPGGASNSQDAREGSRNEVLLVGRVSGEPVERELPSGDRIVQWRVVVGRPPPRRPPPEGVRPATVDALECVAWTAGARRTARGLRPGDLVEVTGSLRRRFFRAGGAPSSRTEVEVGAVRRLARAPAG